MYRQLAFSAILIGICLQAGGVVRAGELEPILEVESQPLKAQVRRVAQALDFLGQPLTPDQRANLDAALNESDAAKAVAKVQQVMDKLVVAAVDINAESRVKAARGPAAPRLTQHGWSVFLVKVDNRAGITAKLAVASPNAKPLQQRSTGKAEPEAAISPADVESRWLDVAMFDGQPLAPRLSGLRVEYRIIQIYSRDRGKREATLAFNVGQGTQDLGFRNALPILFDCDPGVEVALDIVDFDGQPTTAQFVIRDHLGRVYPARSRRLAPDFFFHDQIYRHSGETIRLPPGQYDVSFSRGPEYRILNRKIQVPNKAKHRESFRLKRWIKMSDLGWFSGDHHVHAAGCAHYESPTEGVTPEAMMRHILGEDLNVGCVLSWGPCWYYQKQFFEGDISRLSKPDYLMRYDVEVSGFPSSHTGHLCLLRLQEDDYPGTTRIEQWPSWDLPVLKWGKEQGGVVGFSHSGWGLQVPGDHLPNYNMPAFDGIGANEYVVDVVHDVCDFISAVDTPIVWELNVWYHTLNCGYTCRISGETDFPCIYGERVGLGRAYVKLDPKQELNFDNWVFGLRDGRSYCGDGRAHLFNFRINQLGVGEKTSDEARPSFLTIAKGDELDVRVEAAAFLNERPAEHIRQRPLNQKPYWHIERARQGNERNVDVELIVNGHVVETQRVAADGSVANVQFRFQPERSCWVATRVFPAAHTNPIFVEVDGKPIRASKRSAQWCRQAVDVCWQAKRNGIRPAEQQAAREAYDAARAAYDKILAESYDDLPKE